MTSSVMPLIIPALAIGYLLVVYALLLTLAKIYERRGKTEG